jgi:hypothetical protein
LARTAARYKIDTPKLSAAVRINQRDDSQEEQVDTSEVEVKNKSADALVPRQWRGTSISGDER